MKRILIVLILMASALSIRAQSISDPFFNVGQARSLNPRIIAPPQAVPSLVNHAIAGMRTPTNRNITMLAHLKNEYGLAVWDQSKSFTTQGRETALVPMVQPDGNAITGILVAVRDGGGFVYGTMDLNHPFPYASAALNTPGMPGMRDVLALSVMFNHTLFGTVDCSLIQALAATASGSMKETDAGNPKSCNFQITYAGQNCHHIYGTFPDGSMMYMYSDCYSIYNYSLVCSTEDSADNDGGGGGGGSGSGGGGSGGEGENFGEVDKNDLNPCNHAEVPTCSFVITNRISGHPNCNVNIRVSGCNMQNHMFFLTGLCTHPFSPGNNQLEIQDTYIYTFRTSVTNAPTEWDPNCNRTTERCGVAFISYTVVSPFWGVHTGVTSYESLSSNFCYKCVDCI